MQGTKINHTAGRRFEQFTSRCREALKNGVWRYIIRLLSGWLFLGSGLLSGAEVVIAATADLHGNIAQLQQQIAPAVSRLAAQHPQHFIYVDIGDAAQGSLELNRRRGRGMLWQLSAANCQIFVPGNHEIEYGFEAFKNLLAEFPNCVLAGNLQAPELQNQVHPWIMKDFNGCKIAFIGLMLKDMNNCFPMPENSFQTLPGKAVLRKAVNEARQAGAHAIVLLRHAGEYGKEQLLQLLKDVPEVDLVIGAHTHRANPGIKLGNVWYTQPPAYGRGLLKITMLFDDKTRQLEQIESCIIPLAEAKNPLTPDDLTPLGAWKNPDPDMPAEALRNHTNSDLALYAVGSPDKLQRVMRNPHASIQDYFQVFAYFDPPVTVHIQAPELKFIMREYVKFAHQRGMYLAVDGFTYRASGGKLQDITCSIPQAEYTLTLSAYAAAGAGGQLPGIRRILKDRIDYQQAENSPGILTIILQYFKRTANADCGA